MSALRDEVLGLTQDLIRFDTSNPPGGETVAARFLADYLGGAGVECELVGPDPDRLNLIARVEGRGEGPSLMLLGHTDVVPAPTADWTVPPFEGRLRGDRVLGRGAIDMKSELAARAVAIAELARGDQPPAGDVVLIAESDEERNTAGVGMSWLIEARPDLRCDFALNEGGGLLLELADGARVVTIAVGEKQVTSLRVRVFGRAGHASVPDRADNPLAHASVVIDRLLDHRPPPAAAPAHARCPGRPRRAVGGRRRSGRLGGRAAPRPGGPAGADEPVDRHPDGPRDLRAEQRDPAVRRRDLRLPGDRRPDGIGHPRPRSRGARQ